jgi:prefoldin subunit 4
MLAPEEENDNEVRREDQNNINSFARLNSTLHQVKLDSTALKNELDRLEDASTELMMADDDNVWLYMGECFFETSQDKATQVCEEQVEELSSKLEGLQGERDDILNSQAKLKQILYGRFGKSINLEESPAE